jgi:gamma-glutamylcyclotransferase (GGCT)/AIG2-like uncharacterized protein YtfP
MKRLAVYGTLRRGQHANRTLAAATFVKESRVPGFDLYGLGWYPGIKPNPKNEQGVVVEVFEVPDDKAEDLIKNLDYYEGYFPDNKERSLFVREEVDVEGQPTTIYVYNGRVENELAAKIPSGDWSKPR